MPYIIGKSRKAGETYPEARTSSGGASPGSIQLGVKTTGEQFQPAAATSPITDLVAGFTDWTAGDFLKISCALTLGPLGGDLPSITFNGFVVVTIGADTFAVSYDGLNIALFQATNLQGQIDITIPIITMVPCSGPPSAQIWLSGGDIVLVAPAVLICERVSAAAVNSPTPVQLIPFTPP